MACDSSAQACMSILTAVRLLRRASSIIMGPVLALHTHPLSHLSRACGVTSIGIPMSQMKSLRLTESPCLANTPNPLQTHGCVISSGGVQKSSPDVFHAHGSEEHITHLIKPDFFVKNKTMSLWKAAFYCSSDDHKSGNLASPHDVLSLERARCPHQLSDIHKKSKEKTESRHWEFSDVVILYTCSHQSFIPWCGFFFFFQDGMWDLGVQQLLCLDS